jgi:hypothetical protein
VPYSEFAPAFAEYIVDAFFGSPYLQEGTLDSKSSAMSLVLSDSSLLLSGQGAKTIHGIAIAIPSPVDWLWPGWICTRSENSWDTGQHR